MLRLCGIFTVAPAARTMAYRFYEPRLVQHCKQSAYLFHGSLILVQVKYKHDGGIVHLRPRCRLVVSLWPRRNYNIYARIDNFIYPYHSPDTDSPHQNDGRKIASPFYPRFQLLKLMYNNEAFDRGMLFVCSLFLFLIKFVLKCNT